MTKRFITPLMATHSPLQPIPGSGYPDTREIMPVHRKHRPGIPDIDCPSVPASSNSNTELQLA